MSMAAKLRDLADETSGANLEMEGHEDVPAQSAKDLWEPEVSDNPPSCLPSWSPAWRPLSSCPNMKYCLDIHVTINRRIGGNTPTLSLLDGPTSGGYAV